MNKVIQDLVQEATDTVEIVNPDTGITHEREFFDKEKFVKLILREVIEFTVDWEWHVNRYGVTADILKHFGFENVED